MDIKPYMKRFGFSHRTSKHIVVEQNEKLWLAFASEGAGTFMMSSDSNAAGILEIDAIYNGQAIDYTYSVSESMLTISTEKGAARIAIDSEAKALRIEGDNISLRLSTKTATMSVTSLNTPNGTSLSIGGGRYFFQAKRGNMSFDDTWLLAQFHSTPPVLDIEPDNGKFELVAFDLPVDTDPPQINKTVDECADENSKDFQKFKSTLVSTPSDWDDVRDRAAYLLWVNHRVQPTGTEIIAANKLVSPNAESWHLALASLAFDDALKSSTLISALTHSAPPLQGFAVLRLFNEGLFKNVSRSTVFKLYNLLNEQSLWWTTNRTAANERLHFYAYRYEVGTKAVSLFSAGEPVASPDLNAYTVLLCEALALLAEHVLINADAAKWRQRGLLQRNELVSNLWDGENFTGMNVYTNEKSEAELLVSLMPLILGKQLPSEIAEKLAKKADDSVMETALGALVVLGLNSAGYVEAAKSITLAALQKARDNGLTCPFYGAALLALAHNLL